MKTKEILKPFTHRTGEIIRYSEIFIDQETGEVKYQNREYSILISNQANIIYLSDMGRLSYLDIRKFKKSEYYQNEYRIIGATYVWRRNYGFKFATNLRDGYVAEIYSFYSKKINDRRILQALSKKLEQEYGRFSRMVEALENFRISEAAK